MKTQNTVIGKISFPAFSGVRCLMMPFIQGDSASVPSHYAAYADIIDNNFIEKGKIGFLTIDEKFVEAGSSQRGYNSAGISRSVHVEVGYGNRWGGGGGTSWGGKEQSFLSDNTEVLIANNIDNSCRFWDTAERRYSFDGDLSAYIDDYPEETGILLKAGEVARMGIFAPHEPITQPVSANRQFLRIVGAGVTGRESHFTVNPLIAYN